MNLHLPVLCGSSFGRRATVVSIFGWDLNSFDSSQDRNLRCYKTIKYKISLKFYSLFALEIRNDLFVDLNNLDGCYGRNRRSYTTLEFTSIFFCLKHRESSYWLVGKSWYFELNGKILLNFFVESTFNDHTPWAYLGKEQSLKIGDFTMKTSQ